MFDFDMFDSLMIGLRFEAHGKRWIYLRAVKDNLVLAVEEGATFPAPIQLVERPANTKKPEEEQKEAA